MIGDQADFFTRIKALLPSEWFGSSSPSLDASIQGPASVLASAYSQIAFAKQQTRISTASGAFLDIIAYDFFGGTVSRGTGELDASFLARIKANLFAKGPTRADMIKVITLITGEAPLMIEPQNTGDCGAWDAPTCAWDVAGRWGDTLPYQTLMIVYRPANSGIPNIPGWDNAEWGWNPDVVAAAPITFVNNSGGVLTFQSANGPLAFDSGVLSNGKGEWTDASMITGINDAAILAAINATTPLGVTVWVKLQ